MKPLLKVILIVVAIILIGGSTLFFIKSIQDLRKAKAENLSLISTNNSLRKIVTFIQADRVAKTRVIDSLDRSYLKLSFELDVANTKVVELKKKLQQVPVLIDSVTDEDSYTYLQTRYEDNQKKEYEFSGEQVNHIHRDILIGDIYEDINLKLVDANSILEQQIITKEKIEAGLLGIIDTYSKELDILYNANSDLTILSIKVKTQRNGLILVTVIEAVALGLIIAL